jgi:hypothetical protein
MTIGDLWLGNSRSKISVLEKVTCNLFLGRNVKSYLKSVTPFLNVTVPLQLLVTAILEVTKPLLVT